MPRRLVFATCLCAGALTYCSPKNPHAPSLSPAASLKSFQVSEDFRIELFAAEPDVVDPVEMVFDENGRVYVAEMLDYPDDPPPGKPARSRIRMLEDVDGDGKFDRNVIFAEQVLEVSGMYPWKGGLIVTTAPDIVYMKDNDGDGKTDIRKVLYTGFPKVNPEGRITNLRLGIDNWIYAANNGADGRITSPDHPERPAILVRGADFRFRPDTGQAEPASGPTQFGMSMDDWGNRFLTQNTIHIRHAVVPYQYLPRVPMLEVGALSRDISDHGKPDVRVFGLTKPQAWREQRTAIRQQRYTENQLNRVELVGGYFTAASGGTVYTGDAFPTEYSGNIFTGDVNGNLIHRDILTPDGVSFSARRARDGVEFLASTDSWFRPCNFANAPDGNLYFTDIYREFIETPESIPEAIKKDMDFWNGDTMGRIYRIAPNKPRRQGNLKPGLGNASIEELVRQLENPNGWHRQTAQRLLLERADRSAVGPLRALAAASANPLSRLHALWMLDGLGSVDAALVTEALKDSDPRVREHALRLAEAFPALLDAVLPLAKDAAVRTQFQFAFTVGNWTGKDARVLTALGDLTARHPGDEMFHTAILTSAAGSASDLYHLLVSRGQTLDAKFAVRIAGLIGAKHDVREMAKFFSAPLTVAGLNGLARGMKLAGVSGLAVPGAEAALLRIVSGKPAADLEDSAWDAARYLDLRQLVGKAALDAADASLAPARRVTAIRALRGGRYQEIARALRKVLDSHPPADIQIASVTSLAAFDDPSVGSTLLSYWKSLSPEARNVAIDALMNQKNRVPLLIKAIEDGGVEPAALNVAARARLLEYPDRATADKARRLLANQSSDRTKVIQNHLDALKLAGNPNRGKKAFDENCARCHMPRKQGGRVGPDLSGINNKTKEELLTSMLNPSYAIEPRFTNYLITTTDGRMFDGVIVSETPGAITLRGGSEEGDETVLRRKVAEIRASSISLMPEDLEKSMSKQDLADVIAYLRGGL